MLNYNSLCRTLQTSISFKGLLYSYSRSSPLLIACIYITFIYPNIPISHSYMLVISLDLYWQIGYIIILYTLHIPTIYIHYWFPPKKTLATLAVRSLRHGPVDQVQVQLAKASVGTNGRRPCRMRSAALVRYVCVLKHLCVCVCIYIYMYIYIERYIYIYICIYIYIYDSCIRQPSMPRDPIAGESSCTPLVLSHSPFHTVSTWTWHKHLRQRHASGKHSHTLFANYNVEICIKYNVEICIHTTIPTIM